jgi:hypothetical protein
VSFAVITLFVASQRVFIFVIIYFVMNSVRKLLDKPAYGVDWEGDCEWRIGRIYKEEAVVCFNTVFQNASGVSV